MTQRSTPPCRLKQTLSIVGRLFLVAGVGFASTLPLNSNQTVVRALEASNQATTGGTWRGASFPVENFQGYTSPFGYRRSPDGSSSQEFHRGLDLAAPQGSYIRNWWTGKVVEVSDSTACGTSVVIQSGSWEHVYCHMEGYVETSNGQRYMMDREGGVQIAEGQVVTAGTRLGRVGMTGRTTGPHLHWGLKYTGQYVDPALVLRAMYAEQVKYSSLPAKD